MDWTVYCDFDTLMILPEGLQETLKAAVESNQPLHLPLSFCRVFYPTQQVCLQL